MVKITKEAALLYHSQGKPGKIEVVPTKPYQTQRDLSLAYSPGVAEPCLEIQKVLKQHTTILLKVIWLLSFQTEQLFWDWVT